MLESTSKQHTVGRLAWAAAWVALVVGQLHALSRHNTADGAGDLSNPLTRVWSDPARAALRPLLDWADVDTVYLTYGKIWLPVYVAFTLCALVVHRRRNPVGFERWAWRVALVGYVTLCVGVFLDYYTQWTGYLSDVVGGLFFGVTMVAMLLSFIGSTMLGIALLRRGGTPKLPAWLLALTIPLAIAVLAFTSFGSALLPVMFAFGLLGRRIAREQTYAPVVPEPVSA